MVWFWSPKPQQSLVVNAQDTHLLLTKSLVIKGGVRCTIFNR